MKMQIEVWSDVACPFCFLGRRRLEKALQDFPFAADVSVTYKSFLLNPDLVTDTSISIYQYLSSSKGISVQQALGMNEQITAAGKDAGITFNFDSVVVANTFKAHLLLRLAATLGVQSGVQEKLLSAYFTEGRNVDDDQELSAIAEAAGIPAGDWDAAAASPELAAEVEHDLYEARLIGIRGVPFFLFNRKYAVSGAQQPEVFLQALNAAHAEWKAGGTG